VSLEVFFGEVLEISLREGDVSLDGNFLLVVSDLYGLSEVTHSAVDFYLLSEPFSEGGGIEDFIFDWLGAINGECFDLGLGSLLLGGVFFDLCLFRCSLSLGLFCGHEN
jgi:hypothetical protein